MTKNSDTERTWELIKKIRFCMLVTTDEAELRSRPMAAHTDPENNAVYFLTDAGSEKDAE